MRRKLFASMAAIALAASTLSAAPRTTEPSTIGLAPHTATAGAVWPQLGSQVSFVVTYPSKLKSDSVRIQIGCYQNGNLVYVDAMPSTYTFTLGGAASPWTSTGGAATCVADLYYWGNNNGPNFNWLASTTFTAEGY